MSPHHCKAALCRRPLRLSSPFGTDPARAGCDIRDAQAAQAAQGAMERPHAAAACACMLAGMKWLVRWMLLAAALLLVAHWFPGVNVTSFGSALIAALVLGLLNTFVRPILILLTLPVTLLTLGLFLFVINALMFLAAGSILEGFQVDGFGWALAGSLVYSLWAVVIDAALERLFSRGS